VFQALEFRGTWRRQLILVFFEGDPEAAIGVAIVLAIAPADRHPGGSSRVWSRYLLDEQDEIGAVRPERPVGTALLQRIGAMLRPRPWNLRLGALYARKTEADLPLSFTRIGRR
jgi:hypothetical protein